MTKISDFVALTGASVDSANDLVTVVDMSATGAARNKKMIFDELKIAIGAYTPGGTDVAVSDGGTGASTSAGARSNLGATTVGGNIFTLTNPSAITFLRMNADNTVDALSASAFRTAIGAGSGTGDLLASNNLSDVASATTARTNLAAKAASPSVQAVTSSATVTPTFSDDGVKVTAQAAGLTLANPTGTAVSMWSWAIRIKDNGTARSIAYGTQYRAVGVTLPTTTVISKTLYLGCVWNNDDTKVDVVAVAQEA